MMIKLRELDDYIMEVTLGGMVLSMRVRFNHISRIYALDIYTQDRTPLVLGQPLLLGVDLFADIPPSQAPTGKLYVSGEAPIRRNVLSGSVYLVHVE